MGTGKNFRVCAEVCKGGEERRGETLERLINFDPQWINDIVITGINIFILFFVMSYFLFNPAREVLEKRRKRIAGDLETAKTSREDALALKAEYEDGDRFHCVPDGREGGCRFHGCKDPGFPDRGDFKGNG